MLLNIIFFPQFSPTNLNRISRRFCFSGTWFFRCRLTTIRPEMERGEKSHPCCMNAPRANQNEFKMLNSFTDACCGTGMLGNCSRCSPENESLCYKSGKIDTSGKWKEIFSQWNAKKTHTNIRTHTYTNRYEHVLSLRN